MSLTIGGVKKNYEFNFKKAKELKENGEYRLASIVKQLANEQKKNYELLINAGFSDDDDFDEAFEKLNQSEDIIKKYNSDKI
jgi:hypothetical protein